MIITATHIKTAELILEETQVTEIIDAILTRNSDHRGRKATFTTRQFLFLQYVCCFAFKNVRVTSFPMVLRSLPAETLLKHGLQRRTSITSMYNYSKRLRNATDYTEARTPHLEQSERDWRRDKIDDYVEELLSCTIYREPEDPKMLSLDATDVPIGGRDASKNSDGTRKHPAKRGKGSKGPCDGATRGKTSTKGLNGKSEFFYGYFAHVLAFTPVAETGNPDRVQVPFFALATSTADLVEPTLRAIDRVKKRHEIDEILADKYYSYLEYERWWTELNQRNIRQVLDIRDDQQGFMDFDGHLIGAAWVHCPATPLELGEITGLPPQPTAQQRMNFTNKIMERFAYAARRQNTLANGSSQWKCPALAGKVGCPLRGLESIQTARENGRPIVQNPPLEEDKPAMCCNDTVLITPRTAQQKILFKTSQRRYWGSKDWQETYKLRGSIERFFGHAKVHHGLVPEAHYFKGLGIATLCTSISIASTNISKMRKWASNEDTPPQHPLLFSTEIDYDYEECEHEHEKLAS